MKPALHRDGAPDGNCCPPELSALAGELKHQVKKFLEAKYALLSRARRQRLLRTGAPLEPGQASAVNANDPTTPR